MEDGRTMSRFIGREKELAIFKECLMNDDPDAPWILYFYDKAEKKGGVGKTWLLRQCAITARQIYPDITIVPIDFFNVADRDGVVIADQVVDALQITYPEWKPAAFANALVKYRNALREGKEDAAEVRNRLADALTADLHQLSEHLQEQRPYLLLLLDTYEMIEANPDVAVLRLAQAFPDVYAFKYARVITAGRNAPDWKQMNWRGREYEVQAIPVAPFSPEEMMQYLYELSYLDLHILPTQMQALYKHTQGRPILVGLVTDVLKHRIMTLSELLVIPEEFFESSLVAQINQLEHPVDAIVMFMSHLYHRFNFSLLGWIVRESQFADLLEGTRPEELAEHLLSLSFVRRPGSGEDFVLHDEMRPLVNNYCWSIHDPSRSKRKELSYCALHYYEQELKQTPLEQSRQSYIVESLYHKLFLNLHDGYSYFKQHFARAANLLMSAFARSLLREAQQFAESMSPEQQYDLKFSEARLLQKEEKAEMALVLLQQLEQEADTQWLVDHQSSILFEKGLCYQRLSQFTNAIACFTATMTLRKEQQQLSGYAYSLTWLGYVHRRLGQLDTALHYYEESAEIHNQLGNEAAYATGLMSIGNVYRLQGKIEEALRRCKISQIIRARLFKQEKVSEVHVGWSLSAVGATYLDIDDLVQAEHAFQEALDIFIRTGYQQGIASIYDRFGQIALARNQLPEAQKYYERAYHASLGIDTEVQVSSLQKQGRIYALQQQWHQAIELFDQAIELAKRVHDEYQRAETLIDLASILERTELHEQSQQALQEAEKLCQTYNYNYLLGFARTSQGELSYNRGDYQAAFRYYGEACRYMASFNSIAYTKTMRKLTDALLSIPRREIGIILDTLTADWSAQGLNKDFPELINLCEEVRMLMGI